MRICHVCNSEDVVGDDGVRNLEILMTERQYISLSQNTSRNTIKLCNYVLLGLRIRIPLVIKQR